MVEYHRCSGFIQHCMVYSVQYQINIDPYSVQFTVYRAKCHQLTIQCIVQSWGLALQYGGELPLYTVHFTLYTVHSTPTLYTYTAKFDEIFCSICSTRYIGPLQRNFILSLKLPYRQEGKKLLYCYVVIKNLKSLLFSVFRHKIFETYAGRSFHYNIQN